MRRLLKALRHDTPFVAETAKRRALPSNGVAMAECFKVLHQSHAGKLSLCRVWSGALVEGQSVGGQRIGTLLRPFGQRLDKISEAKAGEIVALAKVDALSAGQSLAAAGIAADRGLPQGRSAGVHPVAQRPRTATTRSSSPAPCTRSSRRIRRSAFEARGETHELLIRGQGEMHLKVAVDKLAGRYNVAVDTETPRVAYRETIQGGSQQHARYKRQTGGHGQFADIKVEIKPLPRGSGFRFVDKIVGGVVPRNFIPAVEEGLVDYLKEGPLGQPVVDLEVTLFDGQYHSVDSSEMSFKMAARIAMSEAMPKCRPVLLEPILKVTVAAPNDVDAAHPAPDLRPPRPAPGLRRARGLERLGRGVGADAGGRDRRHDRRDPLGHPGRRHLPHRVRPSAGTGRTHRRAHRRGEPRSAGSLTRDDASQGSEAGAGRLLAGTRASYWPVEWLHRRWLSCSTEGL